MLKASRHEIAEAVRMTNPFCTKILLPLLLGCGLPVLASCEDNERSPADIQRLSTDVHVAIAGRALVLPFVALESYAYRLQSFSLYRKEATERFLSAADKLLQDTADPSNPLAVDELSIVVRTYGWNDSDLGQRQMCTLLTRAWARSVCDNPWAAVQQALPVNRFRLVDLSRLQIADPRGPAHCVEEEEQRRPLPRRAGESVMLCEALVYGGDKDEFHHAVIRFDGELGALWTVWRHGQTGETAEEMTEREGKAIVAFTKYAISESEDFQALHAIMCLLRRPKARDGPNGSDCANESLPAQSEDPD